MKLPLFTTLLCLLLGPTSSQAQSSYTLTAAQETYVEKQQGLLRAELTQSIQKARASKRMAYRAANRPELRRELDTVVLQLGLNPGDFVLTAAPQVVNGEGLVTLKDGYIYISTKTVETQREQLPFLVAHEYAHSVLDHPMRLPLSA